MPITPDSLMTLEAYSKFRKANKPQHIAHRRLRSVRLGEHLNLQFEDEQTVRIQIQEMLRIEKIFEEDAIQGEIDAYEPLVPDGTNWKATVLIEFPDPNERRRELARLIGVEDRPAGVPVDVEGRARSHQQRLRTRRPSHRPGDGAGGQAGQGADPPVEPGETRVRPGMKPGVNPA